MGQEKSDLLQGTLDLLVLKTLALEPMHGWRTLTEEADLKGFRFHDLRHTAITELAEAGTPDAALMAIAGHMSRRMLEHYSHVRMQAKREAVGKLSSGLMDAPAASKKDEVEAARKVN